MSQSSLGRCWKLDLRDIRVRPASEAKSIKPILTDAELRLELCGQDSMILWFD